MWRNRWSAAAALAVTLTATSSPGAQAHAAGSRPFGVIDSISLRRFDAEAISESTPERVLPSPRGRALAFVLLHGDVEHDQLISEVYLIASFAERSPRLLASFKTTTGQRPVQGLRWSHDERSLRWLAFDSNNVKQIVSVDVHSGDVTWLTHQSEDIVSFDCSNDGRTIVMVKAPREQIVAPDEGVILDHQDFFDLIRRKTVGEAGLVYPNEVTAIADADGSKPMQLPLDSRDRPLGYLPISLSPDQAHAVLITDRFTDKVDTSWKAYSADPGAVVLNALWLIDLRRRSAQLLLDRPVGFPHDRKTQWCDDGSCLTVSNVPTPNGTPGTETLHIDMTSMRASTVAPAALKQNQAVKNKWWLEESPNSAPALHWVAGIHRRSFDPNPAISDYRFGKLRLLDFPVDTERATAALILPVEYRPAVRYPVVLQTHGWQHDRFAPDGPSTAGYVAQELANSGILVAQLPDRDQFEGTPEEGPKNLAMYQAVLKSLASQGMIDPARVGIQGWSRTGYSVRYALAKGPADFTAALIVDGMEAGYFQYLLEANFGTKLYEDLHGGLPNGPELEAWRLSAPQFDLANVQAPLLQFGFGPYGLAYIWETDTMLRRLGKPVESHWLPITAHEPLSPRDRLSVQQSAVDWWRFWLKGQTDTDPRNSGRYDRWSRLRLLKTQPSEK